ncbi:hypothetical protein VTJ49DRAFT_3571 [Mycothermus thermophilus]|uniref:FHA domain-containing protein n=1 Tax=Humicola insolens TaxID=85995 RepID=A0ABR3V7J4_HUMIN
MGNPLRRPNPPAPPPAGGLRTGWIAAGAVLSALILLVTIPSLRPGVTVDSLSGTIGRLASHFASADSTSPYGKFPVQGDPFRFIPCTGETVLPPLDDQTAEQTWAARFDPNPDHWSWGTPQNLEDTEAVAATSTDPYAGRGIYLCGYLDVPLDYTNDSEIRIVRLAVTKYQVSGLAKVGDGANATAGRRSERTIVINPGGPGGSGIYYVWCSAETFSQRFSAGKFDVLGWDPRGVNASLPRIECFPHDATRDRWLVPTSLHYRVAADRREQLEFADAMNAAIMRACWERHGDLGRFLGTGLVAHDLEQIRLALGEDELTGYLVSYGTGIGQTYAALFPDSVGRLILDGTEYVRDHRLRGGFGWTALDNGTDAWRDGFLGECINAGPQYCELAKSVTGGALPTREDLEERIEWLLSKLADHPIPAYHDSRGPTLVTYSALVDVLYSTMYNPLSWPLIAGVLAELEAGNPGPAANILDGSLWWHDPQAPCPLAPPRGSDYEQGFLVICADQYDATEPDDLDWWLDLWGSMTNKSWIAGNSRLYTVLPCRHFLEYWPDPVGVYRGDLNHTLRNPVLLVAETYDPATPLRNGKRLLQEMGRNARLIVHHGYGHSMRDTSNCTETIAREYILHGKLPEEQETDCYADEKPYLYGVQQHRVAAISPLAAQDPFEVWREHLAEIKLVSTNIGIGRKLWLRPGKLYLFGRTVAEPGQLLISDKTVSRKHLTIRVDNVPEGGGRNFRSRSTVIIEDLESKKGTLLNGVQIRGQKTTLSQDVNEVRIGLCKEPVIIRWRPVVLSFSFTSKELRADPWARLRDSLEQLDIKYSADYEPDTTHVVSKKRNTSKGLQALINGKYIVTDSFINAIVEAATIPEDAEAGASSALEEDFEAAWPNPIDHLPPRGEEPTERQREVYEPDERRQEVFDGYTFVFYDRKQYENLFPAIAAGKGKALLKEVVPGETEVDDFIRYVKGVAGEKGLGSFEDGSEGKGVVVVRYTPKTEDSEWYAQFLTSFVTRLDHRPIDQREFLEAILDCDASMLRRPLEEASPPSITVAPRQENGVNPGDRMDVDQPAPQPAEAAEPAAEKPPALAARSSRPRRGGRSRFKGFDFDDVEEPAPEPEPVEVPAAPEPEPPQPLQVATASQDSLFVTQARETSVPLEEEIGSAPPARTPRRKRQLSPLPEDDPSAFIDEIAPRAAGPKRRRAEAGQAPAPASPEPESAPQPDEDEEMAEESPQEKPKRGQRKGKEKKVKEESDILELARRQREEAEALAAAKRKELEELPDDGIDYAAIRALHIIEECEVRLPQPGAVARTRDQDIADGRWDPRWNGRKNFKRFRKQGESAGRQPPRIIIPLEEVKPKEYGIGDDYWLEDESGSRRRKDSQLGSQTQTTQESPQGNRSQGKGKEKETESTRPRAAATTRRNVLVLDSSDEEEPSEFSTMPEVESSVVPETEPSRSRAAKAAEKANSQRLRSQTQSQSQLQFPSLGTSSSKRSAASGSLGREPAAKKARMGFKPPSDDESDSEDELKFRFGRRR